MIYSLEKSIIIFILLISVHRYIIDGVEIYVLRLLTSSFGLFRIVLLTQINSCLNVVISIFTLVMNSSFSCITILLLIISYTSCTRDS